MTQNKPFSTSITMKKEELERMKEAARDLRLDSPRELLLYWLKEHENALQEQGVQAFRKPVGLVSASSRSNFIVPKASSVNSDDEELMRGAGIEPASYERHPLFEAALTCL